MAEPLGFVSRYYFNAMHFDLSPLKSGLPGHVTILGAKIGLAPEIYRIAARSSDGVLPPNGASLRESTGLEKEQRTVAVDTSDFRNGMHFYMDGDVWTIVEFQHVKPGKGGAFVRTRLRKLRTGQVIEKTFRAGERVEPAFVEKIAMQFLYKQGGEAVMMDLDTYEQVPVPFETLGPQGKYLKDEAEVSALRAGEETLGYELPNFAELEVVETDPGFRGDTVSGSNKPAKLETGATVSVPFHINIGDVIKVDTRTDAYLERVKK